MDTALRPDGTREPARDPRKVYPRPIVLAVRSALRFMQAEAARVNAMRACCSGCRAAAEAIR